MTKAQLSKADQIRQILHLSNKEIAERMGCHDAYVRSVRQRTSPSGNPMRSTAEANWLAANPGWKLARIRERCANEPGYRARRTQAMKVWREKNREHFLAYQREYMRKRRAEASAS